MKIYCYTLVDSELDQYVGEDVWVLCNFKVAHRRSAPKWSPVNIWVRFVADKGDRYVINTSSASNDHDLDAHYLKDHLDTYTGRELTEFKENIRLADPTEILDLGEY